MVTCQVIVYFKENINFSFCMKHKMSVAFSLKLMNQTMAIWLVLITDKRLLKLFCKTDVGYNIAVYFQRLKTSMILICILWYKRLKSMKPIIYHINLLQLNSYWYSYFSIGPLLKKKALTILLVIFCLFWLNNSYHGFNTSLTTG